MKRNFNKILNQLKDKSPEILLGVGIVGTIAGTISACKATTKLNDILEEHSKEVDNIHAKKENGMDISISGHIETSNGMLIPYSEKDASRDLTKRYFKTARQITKLYLPSGCMIAASLVSMCGSYYILNNRNVALAATCATLEATYDTLKGNVIDKYGEDTYRELQYGIKPEKKKSDDEEKTYKGTDKVNIDAYGFARIFDETNVCYTKDSKYNATIIKQAEEWLNLRLVEKDILPLNEMYEHLGFEWTEAGQINGWIFEDKPEYWDADGKYHKIRLTKCDISKFADGVEKAILIEPNIDGLIINRFKMKV